MNKRNQIFILLFTGIWLTLLPGCKLFRKGQGTDTAKLEAKAFLDKTKKARVDFKEISLSGKARIEMPAMDLNGLSANYRIHLRKDEKVMIRISKIIEAVRVLATPDSIFVLDKINRRYIRCDYSIAKEFSGLDIDFEFMQNLVLGNYNPILDDMEAVDLDTKPVEFKGSKAGTSFSYFINSLIHKTEKIVAKNEAKNQETEITYSDFKETGGTMMPMNGAAKVLAPETFGFEFNHRKVQLNPANLSFSFNAPDSYERVDCK